MPLAQIAVITALKSMAIAITSSARRNACPVVSSHHDRHACEATGTRSKP